MTRTGEEFQACLIFSGIFETKTNEREGLGRTGRKN
jgi:hypothetical protein